MYFHRAYQQVRRRTIRSLNARTVIVVAGDAACPSRFAHRQFSFLGSLNVAESRRSTIITFGVSVEY